MNLFLVCGSFFSVILSHIENIIDSSIIMKDIIQQYCILSNQKVSKAVLH